MNVSGTGPLKLTGSNGSPLTGLRIFGKSVQNGTPKPDAPITITTLSNTIGVTVSGKNLVNLEDLIDNSVGGMGYYTQHPLPVKPILGATYTLSANVTCLDESYTGKWRLDLGCGNDGEYNYDLNKLSEGTDQQGARISVTGTVNEKAATYDNLAFRVYLGTAPTPYVSFNVTDIQLELGSTATDYVPYQPPQTLDISVPVYRKNLCSTNELTFETSEQIKFAENIPAGDYILSASIESTDTDSTANLALFYYSDGSTKEVYLTRGSGRVSKTFTLTKEAIRVRLYASEGHTLSSGDTSTWSDIQIEAGSEMTAFEPYITESYGLPGVPVKKDGNYTDSDGQQWICDKIDFASGKYIQRIGRIVLSNDYNLQENPYIYGGDTIGAIWHNLIPEDYDAPVGLCEYAPVGDYMPWDIDTSFIWVGSVGLDQVFWIDVIRYLGFTTVDEFKTWLGDKKIPVFYKLNTPIEHDLPSDLVGSFASLVTYTPDTMVSNDAGAFMSVDYSTIDPAIFENLPEVILHIAALADLLAVSNLPKATCRISHLLRKIKEPDYEFPSGFSMLAQSSSEVYLWDLINGTNESATMIPRSDFERYLALILGRSDVPTPNVGASDLNYWMNQWLMTI